MHITTIFPRSFSLTALLFAGLLLQACGTSLVSLPGQGPAYHESSLHESTFEELAPKSVIIRKPNHLEDGVAKGFVDSAPMLQPFDSTTIKTRQATDVTSPKLTKAGLEPVKYVRDDAQTYAAVSYHRIGNDKSPYTVSPEAFVEQMRYLTENGYQPVSLRRIEQHHEYQIPLPEKSILITVDDGHRSAYTQIFPVMKQYGIPVVFYPYGEYINNGGLTRKMIQEMHETGLAEFQLHTETHTSLTYRRPWETPEAYKKRIIGEITGSIAAFEKLTGVKPTSLAYPFGKVDRIVERFVREIGLKTAFTVNCAKNTVNTNTARLNRCTVLASDGVEEFADKIERPAKMLAKLNKTNKELPSSNLPVVFKAPASSTGPEFLGNIADREIVKNLPIEPFSAYFIDVSGSGLTYTATRLPKGLKIDQATGYISGTPVSNSEYSKVRIIAMDSSGQRTRSNPFSIVVY